MKRLVLSPFKYLYSTTKKTKNYNYNAHFGNSFRHASVQRQPLVQKLKVMV